MNTASFSIPSFPPPPPIKKRISVIRPSFSRYPVLPVPKVKSYTILSPFSFSPPICIRGERVTSFPLRMKRRCHPRLFSPFKISFLDSCSPAGRERPHPGYQLLFSCIDWPSPIAKRIKVVTSFFFLFLRRMVKFSSLKGPPSYLARKLIQTVPGISPPFFSSPGGEKSQAPLSPFR